VGGFINGRSRIRRFSSLKKESRKALKVKRGLQEETFTKEFKNTKV